MREPERTRAPRAVLIWLGAVYVAICSMVAVGGITRLTGSGLSMVEWRPLMGILPPLDQAEWLSTFDKYRQSPQGRTVNSWMGLSEFKRIFFWEYIHRLLGRLVGVLFLAPWIVFVWRRDLDRKLLLKTAAIFAIGALQGVMGWLMVASGLRDMPAVSHYRLALHLLLALVLACWIVWIVGDERPAPSRASSRGWRRGVWLFLLLLVVQTVYGAFMAGTRAGYLYQTFPTLNGEWVPSDLWALSPWWRNLAENPVGIHFIHRALGWLALACGLVLWSRRGKLGPAARWRLDLVLGLLLAQFALGVLTVVLGVPVWLAVLHQVGGVWLVSSAVSLAQAARGAPLRLEVASSSRARPAPAAGCSLTTTGGSC